MDDYHSHNLTFDYSHNFIDTNVDNYVVNLPFPVHKPLAEVEDPIRKYVEQHEAHWQNLRAAAEDLKKTRFDVFKQTFTEDNHVLVPQSVLDVYKTQPPKVSFECYDFHPVRATGSLASFRMHGKSYLVRSGGGKTLRVSDTAKLHKMKKIKFEEELRDSIVGIASLQKQQEVFLVLRQETGLDLVSFGDVTDAIDLKWSKTSKLAVLDAKFDGKRLGYIADFDRLKLYDVETGKRAKFKRTMKATKFEFINENSVALLGPNEVQICDLRSQEHQTLTPKFSDCDTLCSFKSKAKRQSTVLRERPYRGLPTKVPDIRETLLKCQLTKDLTLIDGLDARLGYSTAGIKILHSPENNETSLYSSNVLGELFKQTITRSKPQQEPIEEMYEWIMKLPQPEKVLHLTHVVNLSHMTEVFNKKPLEVDKRITNTKRRNLFLERYGERFAIDNLGEMGARFGEIWEDEDVAVESNVVGVEPVQSKDKVASWIKSIDSYNGYAEDY